MKKAFSAKRLAKGDTKNDMVVAHDGAGAESGVTLFFVEGPVNLFKTKVMPKKFGPEAELSEGADPNKLPAWMPDDRVLACMDCRKGFGTFRRKHHCRNCGQVFCDDCSDQAIKIPDLGYNERVRTCQGCFRHIINGGRGGTQGEDAVEVKVATNAMTGLPERRYPRSAYREYLTQKRKKAYIKVVSGFDLIIADNNGSSDPFVEVTVGTESYLGYNKKQSTKYKSKTLEPEWNETLVFKIEDPSTTAVTVRCMDHDIASGNDFMGHFTFMADAFEAAPLKRTFKLEDVKHGTITLHCWIEDPVAEELESKAVEFLKEHEEFGKAHPALDPLMAIVQEDWVVAKRDELGDPDVWALNMGVVCVCRQSAGHEKNSLKLYHVAMCAEQDAGRKLPYASVIKGDANNVYPHELPDKFRAAVADIFPM